MKLILFLAGLAESHLIGVWHDPTFSSHGIPSDVPYLAPVPTNSPYVRGSPGTTPHSLDSGQWVVRLGQLKALGYLCRVIRVIPARANLLDNPMRLASCPN